MLGSLGIIAGAARGSFYFVITTGIVLVYTAHFMFALRSVLWTGIKSRSHSRVAMLYRKFFGIDGVWFVWKVLAMQTFSILLQAPAKLPVIGATAWMTGASPSRYDLFQPMLVPLFWTFLTALIVNAMYPAILLRRQSRVLQRDAASAFDAMLDLTYVITAFLSAFFSGALSVSCPTTAYHYFSTFWYDALFVMHPTYVHPF